MENKIEFKTQNAKVASLKVAFDTARENSPLASMGHFPSLMGRFPEFAFMDRFPS